LSGISNSIGINEILTRIREIFEGSGNENSLIKPISDYKSLFGQITRMLEDDPENIGLLSLSSIVRSKLFEADGKLVFHDIEQSLKSARNSQHYETDEIYRLLYGILSEIVKMKKDLGLSLGKDLMNKLNDDDFTMGIIENLDKERVSFDYGKSILIKKIYKDLEDKIYVGK